MIPKPVFRPPFNMTRASHVVLGVADLARSRAFYVDTIGFVVTAEEPNRLYLRGLEEACHHSLVLEAASHATCRRVGMRVLTDEDLDGAKAYFEAAGLQARWTEVEHQGRTLHTADPAGVPLEICATMETRPRQILVASAFHGGCPQRLDHFQVLTPQVTESLHFYTAMGFRLSEYIAMDGVEEPTAVFLQRKGNPHDIVFARGEGPRLHHAAFVVPETYHLMFVCDQLAENGFGGNVEFGPNRHFAPGFARFVYLRDPDGHRIELFTTHYQTIDSEDEPVRWNVSQLGRGWGARPPESWFSQATAFSGVAMREGSDAPAFGQHLKPR